MSFLIQTEDLDDVKIVSVIGYMGNAECRRLVREIERLFQQGSLRIVLDCSKLEFLTTMSLARLLVYGGEFPNKGGEFKLAALPAWFSSVVQTLVTDKAVDFHSSVSAAIHAFQSTQRAQLKSKYAPRGCYNKIPDKDAERR